MKKLVLILITLAVLASLALAVLAALPDKAASNQMASYYKSHGDDGQGNVNQKFDTNPHWYDDCAPWDCPPGLVP